MGRETEIKLRVANIVEFRKKLRRIGARTATRGSGRVHEWNTLYDTEGAELRARDELLRIRVETATKRSGAKRTKRYLLTFKGPVKDGGSAQSDRGTGHKVREEIELEIADARALGLLLARLGMGESFHYEKYRTTFRMPASAVWAKGLLIELDETPIGTFVELEGPAAAIDRAARLFGFSKNEYVLTNYLRLYAEECIRGGKKVSDMVFRKKRAL